VRAWSSKAIVTWVSEEPRDRGPRGEILRNAAIQTHSISGSKVCAATAANETHIKAEILGGRSGSEKRGVDAGARGVGELVGGVVSALLGHRKREC